MNVNATHPWMISLHGGHSSRYCDHAGSTLEELVQTAITRGMNTFGITEHAPRVEPHRLYAEERALGWTVEHLKDLFAEYADEVGRLQHQYRDRITLLKGFEIEVVPEDSYAEVMLGFRDIHAFEYLVGSVHYVKGHIIDYTPEMRDAAVAACGDEEAMAVAYYESVGAMIRKVAPEVLGHLDLVRKGARNPASIESDLVRAKAYEALDAAAKCGCIIDVNTAGYRKGLGSPYPAPWLIEAAKARGMGFCFGDDSHRVAEVGAGIPEARQFLRDFGVDTITTLAPRGATLARKLVSLD